MEILTNPQTFWPQADSVHFCKVQEAHGQLSNMAGGFPLQMQNRRYQSSEGAYQALKFLSRPDLQQAVAQAGNAFQAKQTAYRHKTHFRPDWDEVKIAAMAYALSLKLQQHPARMQAALFATGDKDIVELSYKDPYWGARPATQLWTGRGYAGANVLGQLLTDLREACRAAAKDADAAAAQFLAAYDLPPLFNPTPDANGQTAQARAASRAPANTILAAAPA